MNIPVEDNSLNPITDTTFFGECTLDMFRISLKVKSHPVFWILRSDFPWCSKILTNSYHHLAEREGRVKNWELSWDLSLMCCYCCYSATIPSFKHLQNTFTTATPFTRQHEWYIRLVQLSKLLKLVTLPLFPHLSLRDIFMLLHRFSVSQHKWYIILFQLYADFWNRILFHCFLI